MTVKDSYELALALMAQDDAEDYQKQAVALVNLMLPELAPVNDSILCAQGKAPGQYAPVSALSDALPLVDTVARGILPYGLAAKLSLDDDRNKASYFNNEFVEKKALLKKAVQEVASWRT